jgi:hypothetical protein
VAEETKLVKATPKHIETVRQKIEEIRKNITGRFFDLGELLAEIRDGGYHLNWGFKNFGEWIDQSGLDMSERAAYYLIKIVETGKKLDIPREKLEQCKLSKLREIVSLDPKKHKAQIKELVKACIPDKNGEEMSLEDVRINVQKLKAGNEKIDTFVYMTIKVTSSCKESIEEAIELCRAEHGDTIDSEGNPVEISIGKAIELICADYLAGDHSEAEQGPVPVEPEQKALPAAPIEVNAAEIESTLVQSMQSLESTPTPGPESAPDIKWGTFQERLEALKEELNRQPEPVPQPVTLPPAEPIDAEIVPKSDVEVAEELKTSAPSDVMEAGIVDVQLPLETAAPEAEVIAPGPPGPAPAEEEPEPEPFVENVEVITKGKGDTVEEIYNHFCNHDEKRASKIMSAAANTNIANILLQPATRTNLAIRGFGATEEDWQRLTKIVIG